MKTFESQRLILREWKASDLTPFVLINQDPLVMEHMPCLLSEAESTAFRDRILAHFDKHGFGLYACEIKETGEFIGYVGLNIPAFEAHFTPTVEIGWRLASKHWGKGYATEGAKVILEKAFTEFKLPEVVSFTVPANIRSQRVMQKIGMHHLTQENFQHPLLPSDHPLSWHVLYRLKREEFPSVHLGKY
ncbi:MAG: GNAT family N-acetyltransferase [Proteobacteria bacterium]|nr:GNAT family N-acetyltransferase [Pseudomonadota bacterium]